MELCPYPTATWSFRTIEAAEARAKQLDRKAFKCVCGNYHLNTNQKTVKALQRGAKKRKRINNKWS